MFKKILVPVLGILLVAFIGLALRLWLIVGSVDQINTAITNTTNKTMERLKDTGKQLPMPSDIIQPSTDKEHPKANLQDWDTISNNQQICWIHKKTHRKVCEQKS